MTLYYTTLVVSTGNSKGLSIYIYTRTVHTFYTWTRLPFSTPYIPTIWTTTSSVDVVVSPVQLGYMLCRCKNLGFRTRPTAVFVNSPHLSVLFISSISSIPTVGPGYHICPFRCPSHMHAYLVMSHDIFHHFPWRPRKAEGKRGDSRPDKDETLPQP